MDEITGWEFPIGTERLTGHIRTVKGAELVRQSIEMIMRTEPGERFYHPDFGCGLRKYVFEPTNYAVLKRIETDVKESLEKWEKRISDVEVKASSDGSERIVIDVSYKIIENETVFSYRHNLDMW